MLSIHLEMRRFFFYIFNNHEINIKAKIVFEINRELLTLRDEIKRYFSQILTVYKNKKKSGNMSETKKFPNYYMF